MKQTFKDIKNIDILPIGVGDNRDSLKLSTNGIMSYLDSKEGILADIDTIDSIFFDRNNKPNFIKADLEGFELNMLMGAEKTIKKWRPKLSITTYHNEKDYEKTYNYLKSICEEYTIVGVGITDNFGTPVMLHAGLK